MRGLMIIISLLFSVSVFANIEQRIAIFSQQNDLFRQICFLPDGTFLEDRILFDPRGSITETGFDCNAQALALEEEHRAIEAYVNSDQCPAEQGIADQGLIDLLSGNSPVVEDLTCPGIRSAEDCLNNLSCNLLKSIFPAGAAAARYLSDHPVFSSCDGTGSCFSSIGAAIWHNLWDAAKGFYHLGSMVFSWAGDQIGSLWGAEDATSSRGIAATEASDSAIDRFLADPIAFLYDMGKQFLNSISEGIKSRYGCAAWSGVPHISECTQPMSWDCANCNEKLNMVCGVTGYIAGNFITNFFTGGAVSAARLSAEVAATATFRIARSVPGAAALMERMAAGGARLGRLGRLSAIGGTIRAAWTGIVSSRPIQGTLSVARALAARGRLVNDFARKKVFLYAPGQDAVIAAARAYHRLTFAAYRSGYRTTELAARQTRQYLLGRFPRLADITAGRYANVTNTQQYFREATKNMTPAERANMQITVTTDANNERRVVISDRRPGTLESDIRFNFTPQAAPAARTTVARSVASTAEVPEAATIVVTARRTPPTAEEFIEQWADRTATTQRQNRDFIQETLRGEQPGLFYLDTQNTALKRLNDTLRNKQLVDAFGNRYNDLVMEALEEFKAAHPGVTVTLYSDYKSMRAAIRGPPGQEQALMEELGRIIERTDQTFLAEVRSSNLIELGEDERWFRAGLGRTADEANLVTRFSRRAADGPPVTFGSIGAQTRIREAWQMTEQTRRELQRRFADTPMLRTVEGNISVPSADVLEVVRKNSDPETVARILTGRYGRTVTKEDAELLRTYFDRVDQFSPGLLIPARVEHRFDQATLGGFSVDFAGVGSVNAEATAIGLAQGRTVRDSLSEIRRQEVAVTADLDALKARTERAVRTTLARHGIYADITISGDDMLVVPTRALTPEIRREIAEAQVAAQAGTTTAASGMRTSFFPEGITDQASRSVQATIGESIEKKLRSRLEGRLPREELRNTLFAVEMRGTTVGTGGVGLQIVNPTLTPEARRIVEEELGRAIDDVNAELRATGQGGSLNREGSFRLPPPLIQYPEITLREFPWISSSSTGSLSSATSL